MALCRGRGYPFHVTQLADIKIEINTAFKIVYWSRFYSRCTIEKFRITCLFTHRAGFLLLHPIHIVGTASLRTQRATHLLKNVTARHSCIDCNSCDWSTFFLSLCISSHAFLFHFLLLRVKHGPNQGRV